jgi:hypothetical protein
MDNELGEFVGKGFALLRDRLKAVEARKALDGIDGDKGDKGDKGDQGDSVRGDRGDKGESIKGDPGKDGLKGDKGDSIKGDPGEKGDSIRGEVGPQGESIKGDPGQKGDPGPQGKDGQTVTGGKGDDGDDGEGIDSAEIDKRGHLIITLDSGRKIDAGRAKGKDGQAYQGMIASGPRSSDVARVFNANVDLIIGETTFVHGLGLKHRNSFTVSAKVNNSSVNLDVDSVDINTIILTSLVAQDDVNITVIGA